MTASLRITVCVCTHDRLDGAVRAVASVLQQSPEVSVLVGTSGSPEYVADLRVRLERLAAGIPLVATENLGLGHLRNTAARGCRSEWVAFLDDDDRLLPGWSAAFTDLDPRRVGLASGGARLVDPAGNLVELASADRPVPLVPGAFGVHLAGAFLIRRDVFNGAGGYLPGLPLSHQTELWIRAVQICAERGLAVAGVPEIVVEIEQRDPGRRPMVTPQITFDGGRWMLARHPSSFLSDVDRANVLSSIGVAAARLGRWPDARRYLARAALTQPTASHRHLRLVAALSPAVARRVWGTDRSFDGSKRAVTDLRTVARIARTEGTTNDLLFLPWRYESNPPASADATGTPFWREGLAGNDLRFQVPVYRWAARLLRTHRVGGSVVDLGCGSAHKTVRYLGPHARRLLGVDQGSGIRIARAAFPDQAFISGDFRDDDLWEQIEAFRPEFVVCSDVIEHVEDPYGLLERLRCAVSSTAGRLLLSTPDRNRIEGRRPLGPPGNPRHIREWTQAEFELLLDAAGFRTIAVRHFLPRGYSPKIVEFKRLILRAYRFRALPDRRHSMAFLVAPR